MITKLSNNEVKLVFDFQGFNYDYRGLFGLTTVKDSDRSALVITEGEFDAMAVYQETGIPTVSLPNGASNLPVQFLPFLEIRTNLPLA